MYADIKSRYNCELVFQASDRNEHYKAAVLWILQKPEKVAKQNGKNASLTPLSVHRV